MHSGDKGKEEVENLMGTSFPLFLLLTDMF